jgi:imidazolonepropionase-like amidohydrolase
MRRALLAGAAMLACGGAAMAQTSSPPILISGARVFDGTGAKARVADVLVEGERIAAVAPHLDAPAGVVRVEAAGKTLIPGLHDLHTHVRSPGYDAPEDMAKAWAGYLLAGVTTINDYSVSGEMIAPIRALVAQPGGLWAPHLNEAVRIGVPGGHGTEFGWGNFFTLQVATPRAAHAVMPLALSYQPDVIKVFADGWRYGRDPDLMSINEPTLAAIAEDAHAAHLPVITHTVRLEQARIGAEAGIDALGHGIGDAPVDHDLIDRMRRGGTAYIATLVVFEPQQTRVLSPGELAALNPGQRAAEADAHAGPPAPILPYDAKRWALMQANVRALHKAGIPIGIGTDAGIGGVYHGPAAIRELTWLTRLGFTPAQALVAATATSAAIMHQQGDHGTIRPGQRADLVLIDGMPDQRIEDVWKVSREWLAGREVPLDALRKLADADAPTPLPAVMMPGPIMTGVRGDGRTDLDTRPVDGTDAGIDHSSLVTLDQHNGASTFLAAQMGAAPKPFVQWVLPLTRGPVLVADASRFVGVSFRARGFGAYRLVLESYGLRERDRFAASFVASEEGGIIRLPFAKFTSANGKAVLDRTQLRALRVQLSGQSGGTAGLSLEEVRFY